MTQPMDYEGYLALGRIAEHGWETSAERAALAFVRAAVPLLRDARSEIELLSEEEERLGDTWMDALLRIDALTATFPDDFGTDQHDA